jgi:regulator of sigma E protease
MSAFTNFTFLFIALLALGASIFVHELGHFLAARRRGLLVERFSIGFGPRLFGWKRDGVDYRVSLLPLGGYVALPQLADMGRIEGAEDPDAKPLPPISYADKMIVAVMGAVFNVIFAFFLALILWAIGRELPAAEQTTTIGYVSEQVVDFRGEAVPGPGFVAGLQPGDEILRIDGQSVRNWQSVFYTVLTGSRIDREGQRVAELEILRNGEVLQKTLFPVVVNAEERIRDIGIHQVSRIFVAALLPGMPAASAGLQEGDILISVDGSPVFSLGFLLDYLATREGQPLELLIQRGESLLTFMIAPQRPETGGQPIIGFRPGLATERVHQNPIELMSGMFTMIRQTMSALVNRHSDVQFRNMSGPAGIVHAIKVTASMGFAQVLWLIIFININLAVLNLLPIPVLDGGHMAFATIAKLRGKPLPRRLLESTQGTFVLLLFGLIIYISFFDVRRIFSYYERPLSDPPAVIETVDEDAVEP